MVTSGQQVMPVHFNKSNLIKGPSIKNVRSQGLSSADILRTREWGSSDAEFCIFWYKNSGFLKFMMCPHPHAQGGV